MSDDERRTSYVAGLRALADALEAGSMELPYDGTSKPLTVFLDHVEDYLTYRALLDPVRQHVQPVSESRSIYRTRAEGRLFGLRVSVQLHDSAAFAEPVPAPEPALRPELVMP